MNGSRYPVGILSHDSIERDTANAHDGLASHLKWQFVLGTSVNLLRLVVGEQAPVADVGNICCAWEGRNIPADPRVGGRQEVGDDPIIEVQTINNRRQGKLS